MSTDFEHLDWPLAAYGSIIRGDETTSEDQVAAASDPEMAQRITACVNTCRGITIQDLLTKGVKVKGVSEAQISHLVNRFLGWKLPKEFRPDAGISYTPPNYGPDMNPEHVRPSGTNLLDALQATEMVRYMVEGLPGA